MENTLATLAASASSDESLYVYDDEFEGDVEWKEAVRAMQGLRGWPWTVVCTVLDRT